MNDVVTAAPDGPRVLVTGFGPFPGAPTNPTIAVLRLLEAVGVEGADLVFARLPVTFAGVGPALREAARCAPDALLMLGLATRRSILNVETLARNKGGCGTPDTDGARADRSPLVPGAPATRRATWPAAEILAALRDEGHEATLSPDAGDYVCNAALFHALDDRLAPQIGFLHVPPIHAGAGTTIERMAEAARLVIGVLARRSGASIRPRAPAAAPPSPGRRR